MTNAPPTRRSSAHAPYKRRPEQVIRIGQRFWQLLIPAFSDLFGEQIPDHIHLHLAIRDSEAQRTIRFIQPDGRNDRERVRIIRPTLGDATEQILQSFEQSHGKPPIPKTNAFTIPADIGNEHEPAEREKQADGKPEQA